MYARRFEDQNIKYELNNSKKISKFNKGAISENELIDCLEKSYRAFISYLLFYSKIYSVYLIILLL